MKLFISSYNNLLANFLCSRIWNMKSLTKIIGHVLNKQRRLTTYNYIIVFMKIFYINSKIISAQIFSYKYYVNAQ